MVHLGRTEVKQCKIQYSKKYSVILRKLLAITLIETIPAQPYLSIPSQMQSILFVTGFVNIFPLILF